MNVVHLFQYRLCDGVMAVTLTKSQEMQERLKSCSQPTDIPENTPEREISEGEFPQKSPTHHSSSVMNSTTATNQNGIKVDSDSVNKLIDKMKSGFTVRHECTHTYVQRMYYLPDLEINLHTYSAGVVILTLHIYISIRCTVCINS